MKVNLLYDGVDDTFGSIEATGGIQMSYSGNASDCAHAANRSPPAPLASPQTDTKVRSTLAGKLHIIASRDRRESAGTKNELGRIFDTLPRRHIFYFSVFGGSD